MRKLIKKVENTITVLKDIKTIWNNKNISEDTKISFILMIWKDSEKDNIIHPIHTGCFKDNSGTLMPIRWNMGIFTQQFKK